MDAVTDLSLLPEDIPMGDFGNVVELEVEKDYLNVTTITDQKVVEVDPPLQRGLLEAGYEILHHDNEGFEAEIFFVRDEDTLGTFLLREGPCEDQVTIKLRYTSKRYAESDQ